MRVGIDATPLLGTRTGIGRYTDALVRTIPRVDPGIDLVLTAFTLRGARPLADYGLTVAPRRLPARALHTLWMHVDTPPVELLTGRVSAFHGTNFVLPPARRAAGVVTVHDLSFLHHADTVTKASQAYRTLVPRGLRRAQLVLTVTHAVAAEIHAEYGIDRDRIVVTHPGVAGEWLATTPADEEWLAARGLPGQFLLFVGTREPRKNLDVLLDAYARMRAADSSVPPLVLVGAKGWGEGVDPDLTRGVATAGFLPDDDLRRVVASAQLLVLPSRYEGFGLPVLEALACGTPVVASDIPALREVGGPMATYTAVGDADGLAEALTGSLNRREAADPAARSAWRDYAATWTWDRCAAATADAYRRAAES